jgi:hypothetical protein
MAAAGTLHFREVPMAKIEKTAEELKNIIFDQIGIRVTVRAREAGGWVATPFSSYTYSRAERASLDRVLTEMRAVYVLRQAPR